MFKKVTDDDFSSIKIKSSKNVEAPKLPLDVKDFMRINNLVDWPVCTEDEANLNITKEIEVMSIEKIKTDLSQNTRSKNFSLETIHKKVDDLSIGAESVFHLFFDKDTELVDLPVLDKDSKSLNNIEEVAKHNIALQQSNQVKFTQKKKKKVEKYKYPGFNSSTLTELPSLLQATQILNIVTDSQKFTTNFDKIWKPIFFSQSSVALLHDSFWWIFLHRYQTCKEETKDEIFTRMADNYVSIFSEIDPDYKDKFFNEFPRCLAQGVYLVFYLGFPDSREYFTEQFASEINFKIFGWLNGFTNTTQFQIDWPWDKLLKDIETIDSLESDVLKSDQRKKYCFDESFQNMNFSNDAFQLQTQLNDLKVISRPHTALPVNLSQNSLKDKVPTENSFFDINGQSPMMYHHLKIKKLQDRTHFIPRTVKRTRVELYPF